MVFSRIVESKTPFLLLLLVAFASNSWGACTSGNYNVTLYGQWCYGPSEPNAGGCESSSRPCTESCAGEYCVNSISKSNYFYYGRIHDGDYNDYCVGSRHFLGNSLRGYFQYRCSSKIELDSLDCVLNGNTWNGTSCNIRKTFGCETITGAGGSQWSQIDSMEIKKGTFVGSCAENGYCSSGESSCSYDSVFCKYNGKNGSRCFYQCSDGNSLKCNSSPSQSITGAGTPQIYCPSKPDSSCSPNSYKDFESPSYSSGGMGDSTSDSIPVGESPYGGADYGLILQAIHDTLHIANNLYRSQNYYQWEMDSILNYWGYNYVPEILENQESLITAVENKNLSVEVPKDSVKDRRDSLYQDTSLSLLDRIKNIPERINFIADSIYQDCLASQANCKRSLIGATMESLRFLNPIADAVDIIKSIFEDDKSPADSLLPSAPNDTLNYSMSLMPYDTNDTDVDTSTADSNRDAFFHFLDTSPKLLNNVDSVKNEIDSAKKVIEQSQDSSNSVVNVDSLGVSFDEIKNDRKYSFLWMSESCGECYKIDFLIKLDILDENPRFTLDLGNLGGVNVCRVVKEIVLLIGFVIVLLITVHSFKSAWEGGK